MPSPDVVAALIAELGKKTGVSWLTYSPDPDEAPRTHAAWHEWVDPGDGGALYVVSGGDEQHLPAIERATTVRVTMRSKENGGRMLTWVAAASRLSPTDERWAPVTSALVASRLNLDDLGATPARWAASSVVTRLAPTGETVEEPGDLDDGDHRSPPPATSAITRGRLPRVLHRRVRRRPRLY